MATVRELPPAVTEVLISDRTCVDDAAGRLQSLLADDSRVRVEAEPFGADWPEHCQHLIERARGDLVTLMPHDDIFDPSWVPVLSRALDRNPRALLSYGRLDAVGEDGVTPMPGWRLPMPEAGEYHGWPAVDLYLSGNLGVAFRGLLRRRAVLEAGIRLRPAATWHPGASGHLTDQLWVLSMALVGSIVYDDATWTRKRIHANSYIARTAGASPQMRYGAGRSVIRAYGPSGSAGAAMRWRLQMRRLGR